MLFVIQRVRNGGLFGRKKKAAPAKAVEAAEVETTEAVEVPVRAIEQEASAVVVAPIVDEESADVAEESTDEDKKFSMLLVCKKAHEVGYDKEKIEKKLAKALRPVAHSYDWALLLATLKRRTIDIKDEDWSDIYKALQSVLNIEEEEIKSRWYDVIIEKTGSDHRHYGVMHKRSGRSSSSWSSNEESGRFRDSSAGYSDRLNLELSGEAWRKFHEEQRRRWSR